MRTQLDDCQKGDTVFLSDSPQPTRPLWTDERPTEPGEYWLSIESVKRVGMYAHFAWPMRATVTGPMCGFNGRYYPLSDEMFDGAKWSRRETPADPFEEVKT
jgi:hypothetical protein